MAKHGTAAKKPGTEEQTLERLVQWFEESEDANEDARDLALRDMDYYDGKQLTPEEIAALKKRGQPDTTFNFIGGKIDFMLGLEIQQRSDPKAWPRNPDDEEAAEAATDALRYVEQTEDLDRKLSEGYEGLVKGGFETVEVLVRNTRSGQVEIDIKQPDFDRIFADPHSSKRDYSDARYMGYVVWFDRDQAENKWPLKTEEIAGTISETVSKGYEDKPSSQQWAKAGVRPRIRIVTIYWQDDDQWIMTKYTKQGILESDPVPYLDNEGESVNPMIMQSAYVDRDNARYGAIRRLLGPQDEENKRRSKLLHMMTVRQTRFEKGAVDDVAEMQRQLARPDGAIETNPGLLFEIIDQSAQAAGHASLMQYSASRMDAMGANASLQGKDEGDPSGRAIIASQQGGIVELTPLTDRHRNFKKRIYKAIWQRIRQFWTEERWIRVTDNEDNLRFVGFNRQTTVGEEFVKQLKDDEGLDDDAIRQQLQEAQEQGTDLNAAITVNVPANMDMDIIIEDAPDTVTIQQEQFEQISKLIGTGLEMHDPRMKLLIRASQLRNKDELLDMIDGGGKPSEQEQQAAQMQQQSAQLELASQEQELEKLKSETEKNRAEALKTLTEADAMDGEIDGRIGDTKIDEAHIKLQGQMQDIDIKRERADLEGTIKQGDADLRAQESAVRNAVRVQPTESPPQTPDTFTGADINRGQQP